MHPLREPDSVRPCAVRPRSLSAAVRDVLSIRRDGYGGLPIQSLDEAYFLIHRRAAHDLGELERLDDALRAACAEGAKAARGG